MNTVSMKRNLDKVLMRAANIRFQAASIYIYYCKEFLIYLHSTKFPQKSVHYLTIISCSSTSMICFNLSSGIDLISQNENKRIGATVAK